MGYIGVLSQCRLTLLNLELFFLNYFMIGQRGNFSCERSKHYSRVHFLKIISLLLIRDIKWKLINQIIKLLSLSMWSMLKKCRWLHCTPTHMTNEGTLRRLVHIWFPWNMPWADGYLYRGLVINYKGLEGLSLPLTGSYQ